MRGDAMPIDQFEIALRIEARLDDQRRVRVDGAAEESVRRRVIHRRGQQRDDVGLRKVHDDPSSDRAGACPASWFPTHTFRSSGGSDV
jgi:hypothetical protein